LTTRDTLQTLAGMPDFLESVAPRFAGAKALEAGPDGSFCFLEQVWHLCDLERRGYGERIRRILAEDDPALADFDGAREAREGRYRERSLAAGLAAFRQARSENLAALHSVAEGAWSRPATQEGVGELRLEDVPRMLAEHDASHLAEIQRLLGETPIEDRPRSRSSAMATALMVLLVVPLLGCPYESAFPLGTPADTPRDARLLGQWHCASTWDDQAFLLSMAPLEERRYSIVMTMPGEEPLTCRGHVSSLKGASVLNIQGTKEGKTDDKWMFVRYVLSTPDSVVFEMADDELLKGQPQTAVSLQAALEGPKRDEIFETFYACARAEEKKK